MPKGIYRRPPWPNPIERIESRIERIPIAGCWIFMGSGTDSYGNLRMHGAMGYMSAHRFSYLAYRGPIPEGLCVLHRCDVRRCVNPEHLFLGTQKENLQDMSRKGRAPNPMKSKTHCPQGHEYSGVAKSGQRICAICMRDSSRRWKIKQRERNGY